MSDPSVDAFLRAETELQRVLADARGLSSVRSEVEAARRELVSSRELVDEVLDASLDALAGARGDLHGTAVQLGEVVSSSERVLAAARAAIIEREGSSHALDARLVSLERRMSVVLGLLVVLLVLTGVSLFV